MAKPIFIAGIPQRDIDLEDLEKVRDVLQHEIKDYYVLVYITNEKEPQFKCFFEKDFDEVKFEELKKIIRENIATK